MPWPVDPRLLATLAEVVRRGSFAAAAESLGYTQSAVSQQIGELERQVGERVVERRPIRVTPAGEVLLTAGRAIQAAMARTAVELDALVDGTKGHLRLGAFISAGASFVPPALAEFRASYPGVHVSLHELDQTEATYEALLRREIDLAVTFDYEGFPRPVPPGVHRTFLHRDAIVVACPEAHRLAALPAVDPAAIGIEESISTPVLTVIPAWDREGASALDFHGGDFGTALNLVAHGLGVALLPELAMTRAPAGVVHRPLTGLTGERSSRRIYLCRIASTRQTVPVTRLEACLATALGA